MKKTPAPVCDLPRLIRPVPAGAMPRPGILAIFDPTQNLLILNKDLFDQLDAAAQRATLRTHHSIELELAPAMVPNDAGVFDLCDVVDLRPLFAN